MSDKTSESSANYILLTRLADEFAARYRAGQRPPLQEYIDRYPELADDIRELFPAMVEVERVEEDQPERPRADQAAESAPPPLGQVGDYRILREVGRGGMGVVYEAVQISLARRVALKVLPFAAALDAKQLQRFKNEAQAAAHLHHTNIVPVYGVGCERGVHYYAMQFIEGRTLAETAEAMGRTRSAAASLVFRGLRNLRRSLDDEEGGR